MASLGGGNVDPNSVALHYTVDGGPMLDLPMTAQASEFVANLPAAPLGSEVRYYISAMNDLGAVGHQPAHRADGPALLPGGRRLRGCVRAAGRLDRRRRRRQRLRGRVGARQPGGHHVQRLRRAAGERPHRRPWRELLRDGRRSRARAAGSYDVDGGRTTLLSPLFDLSGGTDIQISYWRWYTNNLGNNPGQDYWTVQITNDGGQTWTNVEYTLASNAAWQQVVVNLADYFPTAGVVQLKFIADDASPGSLVEALVDDFVLVGTFDALTPVEDAPQLRLAFDLSQNHPNPFNPRTTVSFSLDRSGPATLNVYDAKGSLVKVLVNENLPAGPHAVTWNGDDQTGRPVASGVYFYRLDADGRSLGKRMLLVK